MAERPSRLKQRADFLRIAKSGRKAVTPAIVLQWAPATQAKPRVGFTASRRVGGAVARNRARRRMRALASEVLSPQMRPDTDYVLIARPAILSRSFAQMSVDLSRALAKLGTSRKAARKIALPPD